jgi:hypothetical protein
LTEKPVIFENSPILNTVSLFRLESCSTRRPTSRLGFEHKASSKGRVNGKNPGEGKFVANDGRPPKRTVEGPSAGSFRKNRCRRGESRVAGNAPGKPGG